MGGLQSSFSDKGSLAAVADGIPHKIEGPSEHIAEVVPTTHQGYDDVVINKVMPNVLMEVPEGTGVYNDDQVL